MAARSDAMMKNPRVVFGAVVLVVALAVGAVVIIVAGGSEGGGDKPVRTVRAQLTLERSVRPDTGQAELLVSLPEERLNTLETTGGETSVLLRCFDRPGAETIRQQTEWPLLEEVGFPPHIHQPVRPQVLDRVRGCRLTGSGIDFAGRVAGRAPSVTQ